MELESPVELTPLMCRNILDIPDVDTVGLVLWSGIHPRRHDGMNARQEEELKSLRWSRTKFITAALDSISSALPQATVIACDQGKWADEIMVPLDHKPLATFQTLYGDVDGAREARSRARTEAYWCRKAHSDH